MRTDWIEDRAEEIAASMRTSMQWNMGECRELCKLADMEIEWDEADGDTFEGVVQAAADKLGVEIYAE